MTMIARSLCDSWASCWYGHRPLFTKLGRNDWRPTREWVHHILGSGGHADPYPINPELRIRIPDHCWL